MNDGDDKQEVKNEKMDKEDIDKQVIEEDVSVSM